MTTTDRKGRKSDRKSGVGDRQRVAPEGVHDRDLVVEVNAARVLIEGWTIKVSIVMSTALIVLSCVALFASFKSNHRSLRVFAITQKGVPLQLPFFSSVDEAQAAAQAIDAAAAQPPTHKRSSSSTTTDSNG